MINILASITPSVAAAYMVSFAVVGNSMIADFNRGDTKALRISTDAILYLKCNMTESLLSENLSKEVPIGDAGLWSVSINFASNYYKIHSSQGLDMSGKIAQYSKTQVVFKDQDREKLKLNRVSGEIDWMTHNDGYDLTRGMCEKTDANSISNGPSTKF